MKNKLHQYLKALISIILFDQALLISSLLASTVNCPDDLALNISRGEIPSSIYLNDNEMKLWMLEIGLLTEENMNLPPSIRWNDGPWMPCRKLTKYDSYPEGATEVCMINGKPETAKFLDDNWVFTIGDQPPRKYFMSARYSDKTLTPGTELDPSRSNFTECVKFDPSQKRLLIKTAVVHFFQIIDPSNGDKYIGHNLTWRSKPIFEAIKLLDSDSF